jgi:hypothetical protein
LPVKTHSYSKDARRVSNSVVVKSNTSANEIESYMMYNILKTGFLVDLFFLAGSAALAG